MAQVAADMLGLPLESISIKLGDSTLPQSPVEGGSWIAASVSNGIVTTADGRLHRQVAMGLVSDEFDEATQSFHQRAAQNAHMAAQSVAGLLQVAPHLRFELAPPEHPAGFAHQQLQQADALRRQLDFLAAEADEQAARIEHEIAGGQRLAGNASPPALVQGAKARLYFLQREWLGDA